MSNYRIFIPNRINEEWLIDDPRIISLSAEAHHALGRLEAYSTLLPDIEQFEQLIVAKEATESSRIEGTQTEIEEVYLPAGELNTARQLDREEVKNYIAALEVARSEMRRLPISTRLLKIVHARLMDGVRGANKTPGEFRRSQVWIGGRTIDTATIVPPPWEEIGGLLGDLEYFIHNQDIHLPPLIRIAITHYQFEAVHPFLDGNGRTGRLLIMLQMMAYGLLSRATLYLSDFIDKHRSLYYDGLSGVSFNNNMRQWLLFFLDGVKVSAEKSTEVLRSAIRLQDETRQLLYANFRNHGQVDELIALFFTQPIVDREMINQKLGIPLTSVSRYVNRCVELNILEEITGQQRNRLFSFRPYLRLFA